MKPNSLRFYKINSTISIISKLISTKLSGDKGTFSFVIATVMGLHGPVGYEVINSQQLNNDISLANLLESDSYHISSRRLTQIGDGTHIVN